MSLLLVGVALGIPIGIILKVLLDRMCESMITNGWR